MSTSCRYQFPRTSNQINGYFWRNCPKARFQWCKRKQFDPTKI